MKSFASVLNGLLHIAAQTVTAVLNMVMQFFTPTWLVMLSKGCDAGSYKSYITGLHKDAAIT